MSLKNRGSEGSLNALYQNDEIFIKSLTNCKKEVRSSELEVNAILSIQNRLPHRINDDDRRVGEFVPELVGSFFCHFSFVGEDSIS